MCTHPSKWPFVKLSSCCPVCAQLFGVSSEVAEPLCCGSTDTTSPQRHPLQALKFLGRRPRASCESVRAIPGPFPSFASLTPALEAPQWPPQPTLQAPVLQPSPVITSLCRCQASSVPGSSGTPSLGGLPGARMAPAALVTSGCGVHVWASPPAPPPPPCGTLRARAATL